MECLDFKKNERKYKYTKGKPAYSRHMLTKPVIMSSVDGIFSSRKIMKLAEENRVYMYVPEYANLILALFSGLKLNMLEAFEMTMKVVTKAKLVQLKHITK